VTDHCNRCCPSLTCVKRAVLENQITTDHSIGIDRPFTSATLGRTTNFLEIRLLMCVRFVPLGGPESKRPVSSGPAQSNRSNREPLLLSYRSGPTPDSIPI
jgi:hypothetical protein